MAKHRKRTWWILAAVGTLILLLLIAQPLLGKFVAHKLVDTVEQRTNASLTLGAVTYLPPYGLRVQDATFTVPDEDGDAGDVQMLKVKELELRLAKLPLRPGPLVIQRVTIHSPQVHLIQTDHGLLGVNGLVKPKDKKKETTKKKLSEIFELRHLTITDGQIIYDDRTQKDATPMVWRGLSVSTETRPQSGAIYSYDFQGQNGSIATIKSAGTFDIDNLILDAKSLSINVLVDQDRQESALPAQVQHLLNRYAVRGKLAVNGAGKVPLKRLEEGQYQFDLTLDDATGKLPKLDRPVENLSARVRVESQSGKPISAHLAMQAMAGPNVVHVDEGDVTVDLSAKEWELKRFALRLDASAMGIRAAEVPTSAPAVQQKLRAGGTLSLTAAGRGPLGATSLDEWRQKTRFEIVATADDFHAQPPGFDAPIRLVTGAPIVINQDVARISNVTGRYGYDQFQVMTLRVPLRDLPRVMRVDQISATATFDRHTPGYPGVIGEWVQKVQPEGVFEVGGSVTYETEASPKLGYHLLVHSDRGAINFQPTPETRVPVTRIHMDAVVDTGAARMDYLQANVFGGLVAATGGARFGPGKLEWDAKGDVRDFDLRTSVQELTGKEFDTEKLAGRAFLRFDMSGGKMPESLRGTGEARLINGRLFELPVLGGVLAGAGMGKGLVASEAAAVFAINDSKLLVRRVAIGSPAIGVQGSGIMGFDQSLDLDVIVAPLGEWKDRLKRTGVPLVSKALGEVAGAVQGLVNVAASTLLYQFHVGGTRQDPKITPVPAPVLSKGAAAVFGKMMGGGKEDSSLAEELRKMDREEGKPAKG